MTNLRRVPSAPKLPSSFDRSIAQSVRHLTVLATIIGTLAVIGFFILFGRGR